MDFCFVENFRSRYFHCEYSRGFCRQNYFFQKTNPRPRVFSAYFTSRVYGVSHVFDSKRYLRITLFAMEMLKFFQKIPILGILLYRDDISDFSFVDFRTICERIFIFGDFFKNNLIRTILIFLIFEWVFWNGAQKFWR